MLLYKKVTLWLWLQICLQIAEDITIRYPGLNKEGEKKKKKGPFKAELVCDNMKQTVHESLFTK